MSDIFSDISFLWWGKGLTLAKDNVPVIAFRATYLPLLASKGQRFTLNGIQKGISLKPRDSRLSRMS